MLNEFITYWDDVVSAWFKCANGKGEKLSPFKDGGQLSESEKKALDSQKEIICAINALHRKKTDFLIHPSHMPEPYWGNPVDCSFVMMNYNPAGGAECSHFTSIDCVKSSNDHRLTALAAGFKYSGLAKDFPLLTDSPKVDDQDVAWLKEYPGYDWWKGKSKWIGHLNEALGRCPEMKPFAMELCGWHSEKWSTDAQWMSEGSIKETISQRVFLPMLEILKRKHTVAVCIGVAFKLENLQQYFPQTEDGSCLSDCTQDFYNACKGDVLLKGSPISDVKYERDHIVVSANGRKRNYRVYRIEHEAQYFYILHTWARGSNKQPASHFEKFETLLIRAMIKAMGQSSSYPHTTSKETSKKDCHE